jgi:hypothetical protein
LPTQASLMHSLNTAGQLIREVNLVLDRNTIVSLSYNDISGSPYLSPGFINSTVYLKNGDTVAVPLRYDLYQDELEFKRNAQILWIVKNDVLSIRYGGETLIPEPFPEDTGESAYFFSPETGHYSLYIRKKVDFSPYVPPKPFTDAVPDRFVPLPDEYYLKQEGAPARKIKNKKVLTEILSENQSALDYIKKSKIRVNDPEDLLELVRFLNNHQ